LKTLSRKICTPSSSVKGEDNGDAHLKRQIMGREVVVAATNGKLDFGPWKQIFYGEFDGTFPLPAPEVQHFLQLIS